MVALIIIWLFAGLLVGGMAYLARLQPECWHKMGARGWLYLLLIGAIAALVGGFAGMIVLGRFFAVACALWVSIACVVGVPWLLARRQRAA